MNQETPLFIFAYGTLRRGERNDIRRLGPAIFLGYAYTSGFLHDMGSCPGLVLDGGGQPIKGELYEIDSSLLAELDRVEALCGEFHRKSIRVRHETLGLFPCQIYESGLQQVTGKPLIQGGDWIAHRMARVAA